MFKLKVTNDLVQSEGLPTFASLVHRSTASAHGIHVNTPAGSTPAFLPHHPHQIALRYAKLGSTVLSEQAIEGFLLPYLEGTRLDARMVYTQQRVDVIHGLSAHIGKLLDLSRGVLDLVITELQSELLDARLDCVPAGQTMSDRHVAGKAEILRLENFIGRWVIENRLGVYTGLVGECDVATDTMSKPTEAQLEGR